MELHQLVNHSVSSYRFTKVELCAQKGGMVNIGPMLVIYDGERLSLAQMEAPQLLSYVLASQTDRKTQAVIFHADTCIAYVDRLGSPNDVADCLITIGADKDQVLIKGSVYYPTTDDGIAFEPATNLDITPFNQEVKLLQSIWK